MRNISSQIICTCATAGLLALVSGCETQNQSSPSSAALSPQLPAAAAPASTPAAAPQPPAVIAGADGVFRVKAGVTDPFTDSAGHVWQAEAGFDGGDTVERDAGTAIANTKDPQLFLTEHYGMDSFSCKVPNGKYLAKLYFAETFDGITGPGGRVFSFNAQGHEFKDFDVWVKAGGPDRAYVESVPVEVTYGVFRIDFTSNIENPEINAIELIPQT
jgi:hypothetical protein